MPYATISDSTIKVMVTSWTDLQTEIAAMKKVHERTVQRQWEKARIYLHQTIRSALD